MNLGRNNAGRRVINKGGSDSPMYISCWASIKDTMLRKMLKCLGDYDTKFYHEVICLTTLELSSKPRL